MTTTDDTAATDDAATTAFAAQSLGDYLAAVASGAPTPGGGSVGGVAAALGAALGEMVCALTVGRASDDANRAAIERAHAALAASRSSLLGLAVADEAAYGAYRAASALPKGSDAERDARAAAVQTALARAIDVPLALTETVIEVLTALEVVARLGNRHALADARLGALLAQASARIALVNARGNAGMLTDRAAADRATSAADALERQFAERAAAVEQAAIARSR